MASRLKVDEDLPGEIAELLKRAGFDAVSVLMQGWGGRKDSQIWQEIQQESRAIITADKGYSQVAALPPHHGVVLLRPERESRSALLRLTQQAIESGMLRDLTNALVVVSESRIRIRRMS